MAGREAFTDDEEARVLAAFRGPTAPRDRACLMLRIDTGFRISEALSLRLGDVVRSGRLVDVVEVARRSMKGKKKSRQAPLANPRTRKALAAWLADLKRMGYARKQDFLFQSRARGNRAVHASTAYRHEQAACRRAGLDGAYGTHTARKTFARRMYDLLGRNIFETQAAMGHEDPQSTQAYLELDRERVFAMIERMQKRRADATANARK
jgi:integrase